MPKANLTLPDGTTITIEGSEAEVASLVQRISNLTLDQAVRGHTTSRKRRAQSPAKGKKPTRSAPKGPAEYVRELILEDFFKTKRGLGEVQTELERRAHIYPVTSLSPVLFRLVQAKELRRLKEGGAWRYVNP